MSTVALVGCRDYLRVPRAMGELLALIGGAGILPGQRVLLKPNAVLGAQMDRAVSTHPSLVAAMAQRVLEAGAMSFVAESPGGPYAAAWVNRALTACGIADAALEAGATLNDDFSSTEIDCPAGSVLRSVPLLGALTGADALVNLCKLKTHGMMTYSGAVKNLFGLVPGTRKVEMHARFPQIDRFAAMLNDVALAAGAIEMLHVMDGVVGMEGEGPSHGKPRRVGVLLASRDPWALDHVASGIIGLDPQKLPHLRDAIRRGLYDPAKIRLVGEAPDGFSCAFALPVARRMAKLSGKGGPLITALADVKPRVYGNECVGCGECVRACPKGCIQMLEGKPSFAYQQCIRCYCCQELCPRGAIRVRRSLLARMMK